MHDFYGELKLNFQQLLNYPRNVKDMNFVPSIDTSSFSYSASGYVKFPLHFQFTFSPAKWESDDESLQHNWVNRSEISES